MIGKTAVDSQPLITQVFTFCCHCVIKSGGRGAVKLGLHDWKLNFQGTHHGQLGE